MVDIFAGDDSEPRKKRRKGKRIGTLWIREKNMSGDVTITSDFIERYYALDRADILQSIIERLQQEHAKHVELIRIGGFQPE